MFRVLRRLRTAALALILASPGIGGTALAALHPCPVEAPWTGPQAGAHAMASGAHQMHGASPHDAPHDVPRDGAPADQHQSHGSSCHCIGSCHTAALLAAPSAAVAPVAVASFYAPLIPNGRARVAADRPLDRLPPATAPPAIA